MQLSDDEEEAAALGERDATAMTLGPGALRGGGPRRNKVTVERLVVDICF